MRVITYLVIYCWSQIRVYMHDIKYIIIDTQTNSAELKFRARNCKTYVRYN